MIWQVFNIVFPIFSIVAAGFLYGRKISPDMGSANRINIDVFVPALLFDILTATDFQIAQYLPIALAATLVITGSYILAYPVARFFGFDPKTFIPPMMFNNSGNMGLPLALLAFGPAAVPAAVVMFLIENTLHFSLGTRMLNRDASLLAVLKIPMINISLLGLAISLLEWQVPDFIATPVKMLGQISIPLMLFSLGVRLVSINFRDWQIGLVGAIVAPVSGLLIGIPVGLLFGLPDQQFAMLVVFSALPPAVLNYMVAERYNQEPRQVASIVLLGNLGAIAVIPIVLFFVL